MNLEYPAPDYPGFPGSGHTRYTEGALPPYPEGGGFYCGHGRGGPPCYLVVAGPPRRGGPGGGPQTIIHLEKVMQGYLMEVIKVHLDDAVGEGHVHCMSPAISPITEIVLKLILKELTNAKVAKKMVRKQQLKGNVTGTTATANTTEQLASLRW